MTKRERETEEWLLVLDFEPGGDNYYPLCFMKHKISGEEDTLVATILECKEKGDLFDFYEEDGETCKSGWESIEESAIADFTMNNHCRVVVLRNE